MTTSTLVLDISGVIAEITFPDAHWAAPLRERYQAFTTEREAGWQVTMLADATAAFEQPGWARHEASITRFHVSWYRGEIDLSTHEAFVSAPVPERAASALERVLAYICMQALPREHSALLLHACGVVLRGQGYAFFGHSGAGKTTVAQLAHGYGQVLTDENIVLRLTNRGVALCSTPFWGHSTPPEMVRRVNRSVPLAGLFALAHGPEFALTRLTPGQGIASLLTSEKVATERVESAAAWLDIAGRILARSPVHLLSFRPTTELWQFLPRHMGEKLV